ncbi:MAG: CbiX/SirB N-terminal domain-containing protein, partial [Cyanobacteria bacterium]|nr:CbiX/SirB N-terminal domain-containing protein [Cyanobacteriota bacterium]MDW8202083.1 CbiX/SirB N-terminal domain-containing protein [Cyanobacteriota bacterium SKYGB_h_bin112]
MLPSDHATDAIVLLAHGSRDPRPQLALTTLAEQVQQRLAHSMGVALQEILVSVAWLELAPKPLHQQLVDLAQQASRAGRSRLHILPLFLLPGVHVMEDIPAEVTLASQLLAAQ